ncbi:MAG TPA: GNAT family N-acetyltransferase, partial [Stellaceae bacterium]|nr:GNAT family N-acetyltransferase [Stellaceae bacterium]
VTPIGATAAVLDTHQRSVVCQLTGRDLAVKQPGPGFAMHMYRMRWAIQNGFTNYDFQTGDFSYKFDLGGIERRVECHLVSTKDGRNLRGKLEPLSLPMVLHWALEQHEAGKLAEAEQSCREILAVDPEHGAALELVEQINRQRQQQAATIFVVVGHTQIVKLGEAIRAAYPGARHFELPPATWFVRHDDQSATDVATKIGIADGKLGAQAIVFSLGQWSGWGRNELWEWIGARTG